MSAENLYQELKQRQVELWCQGKMLRFRAPDGVLDEATMAELRKHKKELIELLKCEASKSLCGPEESTKWDATTLGQQAMYFLHLSAPYSPAYNVASAFRICSPVNLDAVRSALEQLVCRHDSLRSTFEMRTGKLMRRVHGKQDIDFQIFDANDDDDDILKDRVRREYQRPFDLTVGPLIRTRLFTIDECNHVFLMVLHHIIFDAWSLWVVQEEFHKLYAQLSDGGDAELLPMGASYSEFVQRQGSLINSSHGDKLLAYWKDELAGELPSLNLPIDFVRPQRPGLKGASQKFRIPSGLSEQIRELAKQLRVTPFVLTMSIFKVLLYRITGQNDLIVGTTTSGRLQSEFTRTVGYFVNTLAIRSSIAKDVSFAELTGHVKQKVLGAIRNQDYPFAALVDRLGTRRDSGRAPICSVMFGLQKPRFGEAARLFNEDNQALELGCWKLTPFDLDQQEGQFDLVLELFETEDSFIGLFKYDTELFSADTVKRLGDQYLGLAESIVASPNLSISAYDILSENDKQQLLEFSSGGDLDTSRGKTVLDLFREQSVRNADKLSVVCGEFQLTYGQLHERSNRVARLLRASGVEIGDVVVCCCGRSIEVPVLILGIMKAGASYLPLDTTHPPHRLSQLIRESGCRFVIGDGCLPDETRLEIDKPVIQLETLDSQLEEFDSAELICEIDPNSIAYILFTSGSTGLPKGVCVPHSAFHHHILSIGSVFGLRHDDRVLQFSNLTFDPCLEQFFSSWSVGASVVMRGNELWSPEVLCNAVAEWELTVINLPPAYFKHCVASISANQNHNSLRLIILGGDVFPTEAARRVGSHSVRILNAYGPTEAVITSTTFDATEMGDAQFGDVARSIPIGRPKPGSRAYVLDEQLRMVPIGVPGRLFLAGPMLASGYLNAPEITAKRFVSDSFAQSFGDTKSAVMYDTGDIARWTSTGDLQFLGRADRQIKIHGIRVETGEIEAAINACDGVRTSYVGTRKNGDQIELVAWVVPVELSDESRQIDDAKLQTAIQGELPKFMVPRHYLFLSDLPLNSSGKIDTTRLPEPDISVRRTNVGQYAAPKTSWEIALANIWSEELNVSPVGVDDNFFDLGGASLSSLRIVSRINEEGLNPTDQPLKPEFLFEFQTIRELAGKLMPIEQSATTN